MKGEGNLELNSATNKITISRAESCTLKVRVYVNRVLYQPTPNDELIMTVKVSESGDDAVVFTQTEFGSTEQDYVAFELTSERTALLEPKRYVYDIWLKNGDRLYPVVPVSSFVVKPSLIGG